MLVLQPHTTRTLKTQTPCATLQTLASEQCTCKTTPKLYSYSPPPCCYSLSNQAQSRPSHSHHTHPMCSMEIPCPCTVQKAQAPPKPTATTPNPLRIPLNNSLSQAHPTLVAALGLVQVLQGLAQALPQTPEPMHCPQHPPQHLPAVPPHPCCCSTAPLHC